MLTQRHVALLATLTCVFLELTLVSGCATTKSARSKPVKEKVVRKDAKPGKTKNFTLHRTSEVDWNLIERGRKAMGGAALDAY